MDVDSMTRHCKETNEPHNLSEKRISVDVPKIGVVLIFIVNSYNCK